ncbi:MAG: multicopper oxidase domain-containing protein [Thermodesulfovibrionales bacterium]|nr:multicopper oxidase domain-containing protein [Thermodesulfovibrionales bacterium]
MNKARLIILFSLLAVLILGMAISEAAVSVQCPYTIIDDQGNTANPNVICKHITGSDGFATMADGRVLYTFGFSDVTNQLPLDQILVTAELDARIPAPLIKVKEGQEFYLTLTTLPMSMRPDLFDPHTVHWHGFPNAATVFDGEPMASIAINPNASLTYYYQVPGPGTYMYHCHVEATEHMQMGMLGTLYVTPLQDGQLLNGFTQFAYNDEDGSTGYTKDYPIQITSIDPLFHDANLNVQPLPFAAMEDTYPLINGRGYPDTINPSTTLGTSAENNFKPSQNLPSLIEAQWGDMLLLRISSLATVRFYTLISPNLPMKVVGKDAMLLRGTAGHDLYYETNSITLGGGQSADVLIDTSVIGPIAAPQRFFLYTSNLNELSNDQEDFGGMMTEIVISP